MLLFCQKFVKCIDYIRKICEDETVKKIYTEVATETYDVHIKYDDIVNLDKEKFSFDEYGFPALELLLARYFGHLIRVKEEK